MKYFLAAAFCFLSASGFSQVHVCPTGEAIERQMQKYEPEQIRKDIKVISLFQVPLSPRKAYIPFYLLTYNSIVPPHAADYKLPPDVAQRLKNCPPQTYNACVDNQTSHARNLRNNDYDESKPLTFITNFLFSDSAYMIVPEKSCLYAAPYTNSTIVEFIPKGTMGKIGLFTNNFAYFQTPNSAGRVITGWILKGDAQLNDRILLRFKL